MSEVLLTDNAAAIVWELIQEDIKEGEEPQKLRVFVTGGGCSGFKYAVAFDQHIQPDDTVFFKTVPIEGHPEVQLIVDSISLQYLRGAEIDYKSDLEGEQFVFNNPNAKTTCGCGSSFSA